MAQRVYSALVVSVNPVLFPHRQTWPWEAKHDAWHTAHYCSKNREATYDPLGASCKGSLCMYHEQDGFFPLDCQKGHRVQCCMMYFVGSSRNEPKLFHPQFTLRSVFFTESGDEWTIPTAVRSFMYSIIHFNCDVLHDELSSTVRPQWVQKGSILASRESQWVAQHYCTTSYQPTPTNLPSW